MRYHFVVAPTLDLTLQTLSRAGWASIVMKGGSVAHTIYPDPVFRSCSDLDLLLAGDDAARAWSLLRDAGFELLGRDLPTDHHLPALLSPVGKLCVEIHRRPLEHPNPLSVNLDTLLARSTPGPFGPPNALILSPEDELLVACLHMSFAHHYRRNVLRGLVDILGITTVRRDALDWDYIARTSRESRIAGALCWPLRAACELLEAPVPEQVVRDLMSSSRLNRLLAWGADPAYLARADRRGRPSPLRQLAMLASLYVGRSSREFVLAAISGAGSALRPSHKRVAPEI